MKIRFDSPQSERAETPNSSPDDLWIPEIFMVLASVSLSVLFFVGAAVGFHRYTDFRSESQASETSVVQAEEDALESETELLDCPEGTIAEICSAAEFVQRSREKPFKVFPTVELLESEAFNEALLADYDEGREDLEHAELAYKGLGFIDPDLDFYTTFREVLSVNVVGFYDPETKRLVVKGGELNLYAQSVLVHELVHAHDDQWFDLHREFDDDEESYGFSAVVEGNASLIDERWTAQLDSEEREQLLIDRASAFNPEDLQKLQSLPSEILELQLSVYEDGSAFLAATAPAPADVDKLLIAPPDTSERVIHPEVEAEEDPQVVVPLPELVVEPADDGKLGEVVLRLLFGEESALGWDGDSYVVWEAGDRACIAATIVMEGEQDLEELLLGAQKWADEEPQRVVRPTKSEDLDAVQFTNCEDGLQ